VEDILFYLNIISDMERKRLAETIRCFLDDGISIAECMILRITIVGNL
jgi:hypothetical protein